MTITFDFDIDEWRKIETRYIILPDEQGGITVNMDKIFTPDDQSANIYLLPETLKRTSRIDYKKIPEYFRGEFENRINKIR